MVANLLLSASRRNFILVRNANVNMLKQASAITPLKTNWNTGQFVKRFQSTRQDVLEPELLDQSDFPALEFPETSTLSLWDRVKKRTGLSTLLPEWKLMLSKEGIGSDLMAGVTVGCVSLPLSLAIAMASGVGPEVGLISAIVGGSIAGLLGGAPLGVTGPSLATTVLLSSVAATHGISALVFVTCVTGALQVLSGALRLGRLVQFVPQPVIAGFTAGVGGVMLVGQLPRMLGISGPSASGVLEMGSHVLAQLSNIHPSSVVLSLGTLATTMLLPKYLPKVPASLVAVTAAALLNIGLGLGAPVIGALSCSFPWPSIPSVPDLDTMYSLTGTALTLYGLTSLESLLSGSAADKIDKADLRKHEPNVELVGQGMSNIAVACFGGIPVTGAIARTSLNITSGAKTRRASLFHVCVLAGGLVLSPVVGAIPLAALSGILLSVAFRLLNPSELKFLSKVSYREVLPLATTFGTVLVSDLVTGVQVGVATSLALQVTQKTQPQLLSFSPYPIRSSNSSDEQVYYLEGDITFISASKIRELQDQLEKHTANEEQKIILDFQSVLSFDATAGEMVVDIITNLEETGHNSKTLGIAGLSKEHKRVLALCDSRDVATKFIVD